MPAPTAAPGTLCCVQSLGPACFGLCLVSAFGKPGRVHLPPPLPMTFLSQSPEVFQPRRDRPWPGGQHRVLCPVLLKDKKYASDKYKDIYTELSIARAKADCDISRLKEQLKTATEALGDKSPESTPVAGYGELFPLWAATRNLGALFIELLGLKSKQRIGFRFSDFRLLFPAKSSLRCWSRAGRCGVEASGGACGRHRADRAEGQPHGFPFIVTTWCVFILLRNATFGGRGSP